MNRNADINNISNISKSQAKPYLSPRKNAGGCCLGVMPPTSTGGLDKVFLYEEKEKETTPPRKENPRPEGQKKKKSYLDSIAKTDTTCPRWVSFGVCEKGHKIRKELYCGRDWCEVCGKDWSPAHQRRFARWLPKAMQMKSMGYFVITFPQEMRWRFKDLNYVQNTRRRIERLFKREGYRGFSRWHWFGDENPGKFHPHLNFIIEAGYLENLEDLKRRMRRIIGEEVVINYEYTSDPKKMIHILKYVTRPTFTKKEWDQEFADSLYGFKNSSVFGKWEDPPVWGWEDKEEEELMSLENLERNLCPICGTRIHWFKKVLPADIGFDGYSYIGAGYWIEFFP